MLFQSGGAASATEPEEPRPEVTEKSILDRAAECLWWVTNYFQRDHHEMEARRYRDPREMDPDYEARLRRLEGGIRDNEPNLRMGDYHEGGGKEPSWRDWMMNILGGLIVVGIGAVIYQLEDLKSQMSAALARQEMEEHRLDRVEARVYRGAP